MTTARETSALKIIHRLRQAGHIALFVGGCVRDRILGLEPRDYDIVTDATPAVIRSLFPKTVPIGTAFDTTVVMVDSFPFEISTFGRCGSSRKSIASDASYSFAPDREDLATRKGTLNAAADRIGDLEELIRSDTEHRDFTVNAMMADPSSGRIFDSVNGRSDLERKFIRAVGNPHDRFNEDPLRMIRAIRLAVQLGFEIAPDTQGAIMSRPSDAMGASPERISAELLMILLSAATARGFRLLERLGLLRAVLPEVADLDADVGARTLLMLEHMDGAPDRPSPALAWAVLLHGVGTIKGVRGVGIRYRWSRKQLERVCALVQDQIVFLTMGTVPRSTLVRWLRKPHFPELLELHRLYCLAIDRSLERYERCRQELRTLSSDERHPPRLLTGEDLQLLGYPRGPQYRIILEAVEDAQIEGDLSTPEAARAWIRRRFPLP